MLRRSGTPRVDTRGHGGVRANGRLRASFRQFQRETDAKTLTGIFRPRFKPYVEVEPPISAGAETQAIVLAVPG